MIIAAGMLRYFFCYSYLDTASGTLLPPVGLSVKVGCGDLASEDVGRPSLLSIIFLCAFILIIR